MLRSANVEMATVAWAKMYEMLVDFDLLQSDEQPDGAGRFKSAHLCEAPGAFICATHRRLQVVSPGASWDWFAMTLNPYSEGNDLGAMIDDDALIAETLPH